MEATLHIVREHPEVMCLIIELRVAASNSLQALVHSNWIEEARKIGVFGLQLTN
ncbi:MAG: hypothetical protein EMLJLAPB_01166 [Candidatus Argoarchaeum ethanivorans]|uniref:Uncharacterized protein n=1 Tax=Candidatus Argoarchaeum ethanivorans TaxID=2608793 RepID=A0A811TJQ4_9EURY|nr:MAG: hypothetical protein EMLJLAPB_01166 [Candidatus Argoarchaeum ethanivorans]